MRVLTGTVLPLVLVYAVVTALLVAARHPAPRRLRVRPVATLVSIVAGGSALFAAAMTTYCVAEPRDAGRCVGQALGEAGVLGAATVVPGGVATFALSRRTRSSAPALRRGRNTGRND